MESYSNGHLLTRKVWQFEVRDKLNSSVVHSYDKHSYSSHFQRDLSDMHYVSVSVIFWYTAHNLNKHCYNVRLLHSLKLDYHIRIALKRC